MTVTVFIDKPQKPSSPKTVNIFDLTAENRGGLPLESENYTAKEKAARITLCIVLTMVVLTAISLLLGEIFGLQWALCPKPHNFVQQEHWYDWPWHWKHDDPSEISESYQEHWNTLSLPDKRKELFKATFGEVDLYDYLKNSQDTSDVTNTNNV